MGGGSPNPTGIGSPIVERKPDGDFDLLMFGRNKVPRWFYLMSCFMVAVRASLSGQQSADSVRRPPMSELFRTTE